MEDYLTKKGYSNLDINNTIDKLIKKGYLNDDYYSKCYINDKMNLSNDGPLKIKKHLEELDIPYPVYSKYLKNFNYELQKEKVNDYINKKLKSNRKSRYMFKNSMVVNLVNLGYDKELVNECLFSFSNNAVLFLLGFPGSPAGKESACNTGDLDSIPGS